MNVVSVCDLRIGYFESPICEPISLDVAVGEALFVVGPNGAGKSTLLKTLVGTLTPIAGSVEILGEPLDERTVAFRAGVAHVFDDDAFFPSLTVREHLRLVTAGHRVPNAADVIEGVLETFGVAGLGDRFPSSLSSGQRRRLLLAAAFARPRSLLLLDEPEQRLDLSMRRRLSELLIEEKSQGGAVILACHDPEMMLAVGDRALLIEDDGAATVVSIADAVRALEN